MNSKTALKKPSKKHIPRGRVELEDRRMKDRTLGPVIGSKGHTYPLPTTKVAKDRSTREKKRPSSISTIGTWELDFENNKLKWSKELFPLFGIPSEGFGGTFEAFLQLIHPEDQAKVVEAVTKARSKKRNGLINLEYRVRRADGSVVTLYDQGQLFFNSNGKPARASGVVINISDLKLLEERQRALFEQSAVGMTTLTDSWLFVDTNLRFQSFVGYSAKELAGMHARNITHPDDFPLDEAEKARLARGEVSSTSWDKRYIRKDGSIAWATLTLSRLDIGTDRPLFSGVVQDITARKEGEKQLTNSRRALQMLTKCNEALIRAASEEDLLITVCKIAVDVGGYRMASVLYANDDPTKTLAAVASWGKGKEYFNSVSISWSEEVAEGRGPAGQTVRGGKPVVIDNIEEYPNYKPWIAQARKRGFRSVVSLPLVGEGRIFGVFGLYGSEVRKVSQEELLLLLELADDLAFGILGLRSKQAQQRLLNAITTIADGVSISTGEDFYQKLLCHLSNVLGARAAILSTIDRETPTIVRSACAIVDGRHVPDFVYELSGSPCEALSSRDSLVVPAAVQSLYPESQLMKDLAAESYVGRSLLDEDGRNIGMIYVVFRHGLEDFQLVSATLKVFAARAAGEMVRHARDAKIREQALLLDRAQDAIIVRDLDQRILYWNQGAEKTYGWKADEVLGKSLLELKIVDAEAFGAAMQALQRQGEWVGEIMERTKCGGLKLFECHWTLVRGENGASDSVLAINTDISERKRSERQLRLLEASLQRLNDIILITEADPLDEPGPRIVYVNDAFSRHTGYTAEEVIGRSPRFLQGPLTSRDELTRIRQALLRREHVRAELVNYTKTGVTIWLEIDIVPLINDRGNLSHFVAVQRDITERKATARLLRESEARLSQIQRLDSLGQLTGGIAHDFNNLLTVILGNAEILAEQLRETPHLFSLATMIRTAGTRGAELNSRLLAFARKQALEPRNMRVGDTVESMLPLLQRALGESIQIMPRMSDEDWPVAIDPGQLESAILNLCINARDAMPDGGKLRIETSKVHLEQNVQDRNGELAAGDYVLLSISDTGIGIAPDAIEHVFEPFFTTKQRGKGTGLGLSMVYGFTKQSGGQVRIYSELNVGTEVKLYLPRTENHTVSEAVDLDQCLELAGEGVILLVEDDDLVRRNSEALLTELGYRVVTASNGPEAMRLAAGSVHFDLLFTDLMMPGGMNGVQLAMEMRGVYPSIPVLLTSGYTDIGFAQQTSSVNHLNVLHKPYTGKELASKIRQAIRDAADLDGEQL